MNEHRLQARAPYFNVIDRATSGPDPFKQGRQLCGDVLHPRLHNSLVTIRAVIRTGGLQEGCRVKRTVETQRDQPIATDRLLDQWSGGKQGLRDVYRALVKARRFRPGRALFGPRDYAAALAVAAGTPDRARRLEDLEEDGLAAELDTLLRNR